MNIETNPKMTRRIIYIIAVIGIVLLIYFKWAEISKTSPKQSNQAPSSKATLQVKSIVIQGEKYKQQV